MKQVIIYGVYNINVRRKIEFLLNKDYSVIGYMDTYLKSDILDKKRYIAMDELIHFEYDFIIIAVASEKAIDEIKSKLIENGGCKSIK